MDRIIEYVQIPNELDLLATLYNKTIATNPLEYIECGAKSWVLNAREEYREFWQPILKKHEKVHNQFCEFATGFNFNKTESHTVPPHIDIGPPNFFNLLIPVFGVARIDLFETNQDELEFRHGQNHWMMQKQNIKSKKIGEFFIDKPTLLNTNYLHSVQPVEYPRCVWCTRWISIPLHLDFNGFKKRIEKVLNA